MSPQEVKMRESWVFEFAEFLVRGGGFVLDGFARLQLPLAEQVVRMGQLFRTP